MFNPAQFESMKGMMNAQNMKQCSERISSMSDEQLRNLMAMTGMQGDPSMLRNAASAMSGFNDEQLNAMKNMAPQSTPQEKLSPNLLKVTDIKNQGNQSFKHGEFTKAAQKYQEALEVLSKEPISEQLKTLEVSCRMNLATCLAKEFQWEEIITQSKKVKVI